MTMKKLIEKSRILLLIASDTVVAATVLGTICYADNPIIQKKYTANPVLMVFDGTVYFYTSHVAAMIFAAIDVEKEQDKGNDGHGSKVIVVPFDGAALDRDLQAN